MRSNPRRRVLLTLIPLLVILPLGMTVFVLFSSQKFKPIDLDLDTGETLRVLKVTYGKRAYVSHDEGLKEKIYTGLPALLQGKTSNLFKNVRVHYFEAPTNKGLFVLGKYQTKRVVGLNYSLIVKNERGEAVLGGGLQSHLMAKQTFFVGYCRYWPSKSRRLEIGIQSETNIVGGFKIWNPAYVEEDVYPVVRQSAENNGDVFSIKKTAHQMVDGKPMTVVDLEIQSTHPGSWKILFFELSSWTSTFKSPGWWTVFNKEERWMVRNVQNLQVSEVNELSWFIRLDPPERAGICRIFIPGFLWSDEPLWRLKMKMEKTGASEIEEVEVSFPGNQIERR